MSEYSYRAPFHLAPHVQADQEKPVQIGDLVADLCRRLGINPRRVTEVRIEPLHLWIKTQDLNGDGHKYVLGTDRDPDSEQLQRFDPRAGMIAESVTHWAIRTTLPNSGESDAS